MAFPINTLAGAAYKVLCASPDPARKEMHQACFDYLSLGRTFSNKPLALLSGLNLCLLSLIFQVFVVGLYAVGRSLLPFPSPSRIWSVARLILVSIGKNKMLQNPNIFLNFFATHMTIIRVLHRSHHNIRSPMLESIETFGLLTCNTRHRDFYSHVKPVNFLIYN